MSHLNFSVQGPYMDSLNINSPAPLGPQPRGMETRKFRRSVPGKNITSELKGRK